MSVKLGVVMDAIENITVKKDSTLAMMLAAQKQGWQIFYMQQNDLYIRDGVTFADMQEITVYDNESHWFEFGEAITQELHQLDVVLMRKDPPFDTEYIYTTYLLELAEKQGLLVVNKPQSLRDANEKVFTAWFPDCTPANLITRNKQRIKDFLTEHKDIVLKPLHSMGGGSIFRVDENNPNVNVVIELLTEDETRFIMAQKFIPEISEGDKRILMIDGEPVPYALARVPKEGELRGNLAAGGTGVGVELSERDRWICQQVGPVLKEKGLLFVGLDVIGDYLTEINVTSPTCIRELEKLYKIDISGQIISTISAHCGKNDQYGV